MRIWRVATTCLGGGGELAAGLEGIRSGGSGSSVLGGGGTRAYFGATRNIVLVLVSCLLQFF